MEVPAKLLGRYMERRKKDFELCQSGLAQKNFEDLARVGHQLKGNAHTFGFDDLSVIGKKMEAAAQEKDVSELENALRDFHYWLDKNVS